eukprot:1155659-Pelagomonas_calceolata.AAC.4
MALTFGAFQMHVPPTLQPDATPHPCTPWYTRWQWHSPLAPFKCTSPRHSNATASAPLRTPNPDR